MVRLKKHYLVAGIWWAIGAIATIYLYLFLDVTGPQWGVVWGPQRLLLMWVPAILVALPMAYLTIMEQASNPWMLAPIGRYTPGVKYKLLYPRRYVEIAVGAAAIAAFDAIALPFTGVSLCCIGLIFIANFFGPFTIFSAIVLAWIIEVLFGFGLTAGSGPLFIIVRGFNDGSIYALAALFFWRFILPRILKGEKGYVWLYIPYFAAWNAWHLVLWSGYAFSIGFGIPAYYPAVAEYLATCYPTNIISGIIGCIATEVAVRAVTGRRREETPT